MEATNSNLVEGILAAAREKAQSIMAEANTIVLERRRATADRAERIKAETRDAAEKSIQELERKESLNIGMESRRILLRVREEILGIVLNGVEKRMAELISEPEYERVLLGWIVEAAIGLEAPAAEVLTSQAEKAFVTAALLRTAEREVTERTGRQLSLSLSAAPPSLSQGVVVTSLDRKTAYNNQVATRILRAQSEIRRMLHSTLGNMRAADEG